MEPTVYQICVRGRLTGLLISAFDDMNTEASATHTTLSCEIRDQSQLFGLLDRIRDLGLELVSLQPYAPTFSAGEDTPD